MMTNRTRLLLTLWALTLAAAALLAACAPAPARVTVRATLDPTGPPPAVRVVRRTCPRTHYYRQGRYHWLRGRYVFRKGRCVRRPSTWHSGCRFVPGRWVKRGPRYEYRPGSTLCRSVKTVAHPITLPPPMRPPAHRCSAKHYLQRGYWKWTGGRWQWRPGRCVLRVKQWKARGCRYHPASWRRVGKRILYTKGGLVCRRPLTRVTPRRCTAAMRKAGRCGRAIGVLRVCPKGYRWVQRRCQPVGVRRCTAAMRKAGRCR